MASKLTSADISEITRQSDVISKNLRDNFTNIKNKTNELIDDLAAVSIGTTNAETTAARPYHTSLKERLDSNWSGQHPYVKSGGLVEQQTVPNMTVSISAGEAKINGIDVKWTDSNTGTITAPTTNDRIDIIAVQSDSTIVVVTGSESANPQLPDISSTQRALSFIYLENTTASITSTEITDCRDQGCYYFFEGKQYYQFKIQDAIDDLSNGGTIIINNGTYYESLTYDDNQIYVFSGGSILKNPTGGATINFEDIDLSTYTNTVIKWNNGASYSDGKIYTDNLYVDTISEKTSANGVSIDGALIKDSGAQFDDIESVSGSDGPTLTDGFRMNGNYKYWNLNVGSTWDMDANASKTILSNVNIPADPVNIDIMACNVMVYGTSGGVIWNNLWADPGAYLQLNGSSGSITLTLYRTNGGKFDNSTYNSAIIKGVLIFDY